MRAHVEITLLTSGVPFAVLQEASEEDILRWYSVLAESRERDNDELSAVLQQGGY